MKNKNLSVVLLILLSMTFGCRLLMKQSKTNFFEKNAAEKAANAVKSKVGFSFKVQEVEITENTFTMKIETPGNPQNVDEYTYLGYFVPEPKPVQLNGNTRTLDKLPFEEIDFTVVPQIVKNALEKTRVEGGKVTKLDFYAYKGYKFGWNVTIQGTRESASAGADINGNIVSIDLSQTSRAAEYKIINEPELNSATAAIKSRFGEDARFAEVKIDEKWVSLKAANKENANMLDTFAFGISGLKKTPLPPLPASISGEPFAFSSIDLKNAISLLQRTKDKLKLPDGQVSAITIKNETDYSLNKIRQNTFEKIRLVWTVSIKKGLNSGFVKYDDKLNEIDSKMN